ncbi:MAG: MFS transporter [candidate division KSB1 bacterium]|nr:MFS transporter [candidate division KSB1 bacterium]MDZ7369062.1 MFS transporter [candidate division KSB1 bacterium]MDZ7407287.1 MFS transporter [candidate division KSB1 bacterium]
MLARLILGLRNITPTQWRALIAAQAGWMLDAMDVLLYTFALTTIQKEFQFDSATAGSLASVTLLASAVGGILFGIIADYVGRTKALVATILIYSFCSAGTATAQNLWQLILWRSLLGIGMGGEWSSGAVLVSETWPAEHRGKAIGIMQSGWALGYILAAIVSAIVLPTLGWRALFVVGVLPALLTIWIRRRVPEPELWKAGQTVSRPLSSFLKEKLSEIFKPAFLRRTLVATLITSFVLFAYWGLFTWLPGFLSKPMTQGGAGMSIVKTSGWIIPVQIGAFFGYLSFGFIADRFGRKPAFIFYLIAAAILVPIYGQMARNDTVLMILGPFIGFFGSGYFSLFGAMLAELFPTKVRATGQGFAYNAGRAFSALAPFIIGGLADIHGIGSALALTSAFFLIGACMVLLLPETRGTVLE